MKKVLSSPSLSQRDNALQQAVTFYEKNASGSQHYLKSPPAVPALLVSLWASSWPSGAAAQSPQRHTLCASLRFSRSWTAFLLLSCHAFSCRSRNVLAKESLLAVARMGPLAFR